MPASWQSFRLADFDQNSIHSCTGSVNYNTHTHTKVLRLTDPRGASRGLAQSAPLKTPPCYRGRWPRGESRSTILWRSRPFSQLSRSSKSQFPPRERCAPAVLYDRNQADHRWLTQKSVKSAPPRLARSLAILPFSPALACWLTMLSSRRNWSGSEARAVSRTSVVSVSRASGTAISSLRQGNAGTWEC